MGHGPESNTFSGTTPSHRYDAPFTSLGSWQSSPTQDMVHPMTAASSSPASSHPQPNLVCDSHSYIVSSGLYTFPPDPASLSHLSLMAQCNNQHMLTPTMSALHPTQVLSSNPGMDFVPGHQNPHQFSATPVTWPISWECISDDKLEHVMAAMADPSHPISRGAYQGPYYEAGRINMRQNNATWNHPTAHPPEGYFNQREAQPQLRGHRP